MPKLNRITEWDRLQNEMDYVAQSLMGEIAQARNWHHISVAAGALFHARLVGKKLLEETRTSAGPTEAQYLGIPDRPEPARHGTDEREEEGNAERPLDRRTS